MTLDRQQTYAPGDQISASDLNAFQDKALRGSWGSLACVISSVYPTMTGAKVLHWQYGTGAELANGTLCEVDGSIDWRDHVAIVAYAPMGAADEQPGAANDYTYDEAISASRVGYTGKGAKDAGAAAPTNGNPPVPAATTSYAVQITTGLWLYADPNDYKLKLYNNTGANIRRPILWVAAIGKTGLR